MGLRQAKEYERRLERKLDLTDKEKVHSKEWTPIIETKDPD